jgi:hypothetical protein
MGALRAPRRGLNTHTRRARARGGFGGVERVGGAVDESRRKATRRVFVFVFVSEA